MSGRRGKLDARQVWRAARLLRDARETGRPLAGFPPDLLPTTAADGYAIQDELAEQLGRTTVGWFCAATNPEVQALLGIERPVVGRVFESNLHVAPARLARADYPPMVAECEFAFTFGRALPARATPYSRAEVTSAVASVHPAIECCAGWIEDWQNRPAPLMIADNGTDGPLVVGLGRPVPEGLGEVAVELHADGRRVRRGCGRLAMGDPLTALEWLVDDRRERGVDMERGSVISTGTVTMPLPIRGPVELRARFAALGEVRLTIT